MTPPPPHPEKKKILSALPIFVPRWPGQVYPVLEEARGGVATVHRVAEVRVGRVVARGLGVVHTFGQLGAPGVGGVAEGHGLHEVVGVGLDLQGPVDLVLGVGLVLIAACVS